MYVRVYVCTYVRMYVCTYVRMYVRVYVCTYVCITYNGPVSTAVLHAVRGIRQRALAALLLISVDVDEEVCVGDAIVIALRYRRHVLAACRV